MSLLGVAGAWTACSPADDTPPEKDPTTYTCPAGSRLVWSGCVPPVFDTAIVPPKERLAQIDTDGAGVRYVRASLLVVLNDASMTLEAARELAAKHGGEVIGAIPFAGFYQLSFNDTPTADALGTKASVIAADPAVAGVSRDDLLPSSTLDAVRPKTTDYEAVSPSSTYDEYYGTASALSVGPGGKTALDRIQLTQAWDAIHSANPPLTHVTVGILDTIVNKGLFPTLTFSGARDLRVFGTADSTSVGANHGTAVATLIGAPNDASGTTGILGGLTCSRYDLAPMAVVEEEKPEPPLPRGSDLRIDAIFYGVVYAVQAGARVVNGSLGQSLFSGERRFALARGLRRVVAAAPDTLFVFAAGNDGQDAAFAFPCSVARQDEDTTAPNVVCVAATAADDDRAAVWFHPTEPGRTIGSTNKDVVVKTVTLAAPGDRLLAQLPNGKLTMFSGTSGAAPLVTGAAGLLFEILPGLDGELAKRILVESADPIPDATLSGRRLNVAKAVTRALGLARRYRPETMGQGECRVADGGGADGGVAQGVCVAPDPSQHQCSWDTDTECTLTKTIEGTKTDVQCNGDVRFPWQDDSSLVMFLLAAFDTNLEGVFVTVYPKDAPITVTGTRTSGSITVHIESATPIGVLGYASGGGTKITKLDAKLQWTPTIVTGEWTVGTLDPSTFASGKFKGTYRPPPYSQPQP
jgi:hypothetical protein